MKLLSWNVNIFNEDIGEVIDFIIQEDPDIICLQEVLAGLDRNVYRGKRFKRIIDNELDVVYRFKFFSPNFETYPYKFQEEKVDFGGLTQQGNYLLSKYKFTHTEQIFYHRNYSQLRENDWVNIREEWMPCSIQIADLEVGLKTLRIINNHGLWTKDRAGDERTVKEIEIIKSNLLSDISCPNIITGDFNLLPDTESIKLLSTHFHELVSKSGSKGTSITSKGLLPIDYMFVNNEVKVSLFEVRESKISDHYPLILEFEV